MIKKPKLEKVSRLAAGINLSETCTLSLVTVGQSPWDDIKILEWGLGHLISEF